MKLTSDQYRRGLLSWTAMPGGRVAIGTSASVGAPVMWSSDLEEPSGSAVPIELLAKIQFGLKDFGQLPNNFSLKLECVQGGVVRTRIWNGVPGEKPVILMHLPAFGRFRRLVVDAATLGWDSDCVFRTGDVLVRFITGSVEGEKSGDLKPVMSEDGSVSVLGTQETAVANGRFIEIVAPGPSDVAAELHARALLGAIALALGQNAVGPIVFDEPWEATPEQQLGQSLVFGRQFPRQAVPGEFDPLDQLLGRVIATDPVGRARVIALRWYERGFRSSEPLDRLLSYYIGVEALVTSLARVSAPIPIESNRAGENDSIIQAVTPLGDAVRQRVSQRMRGASIREQFDFYTAQRGLEQQDRDRFAQVKRLRDEAVHGHPVEIGPEVAAEGEKLLRVMLKADLELPGHLGWEDHPAIHAVGVEFSLQAGPPQAGQDS